MRAQFGLPSVRSSASHPLNTSRLHEFQLTHVVADEVEKRAPITVKFEIPYFTVSGIQVRYLKIVEKSGYQALPWVRYITQHGDDYR
jgi:AP-1 complex subunit mu